MSQEQDGDGIEEIAASLTQTAIALWGFDRVEVLQPVIEETAQHILRVSQHLPPADQDPGFSL